MVQSMNDTECRLVIHYIEEKYCVQVENLISSSNYHIDSYRLRRGKWKYAHHELK